VHVAAPVGPWLAWAPRIPLRARRAVDDHPAANSRIVNFPEKERNVMNVVLIIGPLLSLIAGLLILVIPRLLNYIVALYLIVIGLIGIAGPSQWHI
jgi:hypothetical protein